jgi:hypothetical protein
MMKIAVMAIALMMGSLAFGQNVSPSEKAHNLTVKLTNLLSLDADQASQIAEINQGIAEKNQNVRTATNMTADEKVQVLQSNNDARLYMYKGILTTEQYAKVEVFEQTKAPEYEL